MQRAGSSHFPRGGGYFLGKMVWAKGYMELVDLVAKHKRDLEGFSEDSQEVHTTARKLDLNLNFFEGKGSFGRFTP